MYDLTRFPLVPGMVNGYSERHFDAMAERYTETLWAHFEDGTILRAKLPHTSDWFAQPAKYWEVTTMVPDTASWVGRYSTHLRDKRSQRGK